MHPSKGENTFMIDGVWSMSLLGKPVEGVIVRKGALGRHTDRG